MKAAAVLRPVLVWGGAGAALLAAALLRNPLLLPLRPIATPLLFAVAACAVLALGTLCKRASPYRKRHAVLLLLWLVALAIASVNEGMFRWHRHQVLHSDLAQVRGLGAHIIIGYGHPEEARQLAQHGLVGGIFVAANTLKGKTVEAIAAEIAALQALRARAGLEPLLVSTDQEGGMVARMSPPLAPTPPLATVIAGVQLGDIEPLAFAYGQAHGRGLAALGVNVNFSPLADLSFPRVRSRLDFHSLISHRALDADPHRVSAAVIGYTRGLEAYSVQGTLKHFPGLGRVASDTHLFNANLPLNEAGLENSDWIPFREGLKATHALMMVGHASLSAVDADNPASLSRKVVQGIVRGRWRHEGVLVTDDMAMAPVVRHGMCNAGVDAISAGMDLLLVSYDTDQYYTIMDCLLQAQRQGRLDGAVLQASDRRLDKLRAGWR